MVFSRSGKFLLRFNRTKGFGFYFLLCCSIQYAWALDAEHIVEFDIDENNADSSLIEFAVQADLTIVFPLEKVGTRKAQALKGRFSVEQGIDKLLVGTGLKATFERDGVVKIKRISIIDTIVENKGFISKVLDLFTENDDDLVTYPEETSNIELIEIKGLRSSIDWAVDLKKESSGVFDAIFSEDIGDFPDTNIAESLQRLSGVSIDRSEGEGQFVTVRGFGPEFNTVLSNGRRLATDNQGREFSFDTLATDLVTSIKVNKTFSASQPSGGIGSIINIETTRPFSSNEFKLAGSIKGTFDTNSQEVTPQGTVFMSNSNDKLGWLLSFSHQERSAKINEAQTDGWLLNTDVPEAQLSNNADNLFVPRNFDQRVRFDNRTRTGGTAVIQYNVNEDIQVSVDYLRSDFTVKTDSTSLGHWFTSSNLENVITDPNGTAISFSQTVGHATDFHSRTFDRPSSISALGINTKWQISSEWDADIDFSTSRASTQDTLGAGNALTLIGYLNRSSFSLAQSQVLPIISNFESADPTILDALGNVKGVANYLDPSNGRAHVMLRRGWNIQDRFDQAKLDLNKIGWLDSGIDLAIGGMYTHQSKSNERWDNERDSVHCSFCGYFETPDIPDDFQTRFDAGDDFLDGVSGSDSLPTQWLRHNGEALFDFLESVSDVNFDAVLRNNSFFVEESVMAAYIEGKAEFYWFDIPISSVFGVRYESTDIVVSGFESDLVGLTILDQTELGQVNSQGTAISQSSDYDNWLPSVSFKAELSDNLVGRLALSRSLTRPTMTQLSPSLVVNATRQGGDFRASIGSPNLTPFVSTNFDLAVEWYYLPSSYVSINYFQKVVDNFIVRTVETMPINGVTDPSTGSDPLLPDDNDGVALFDTIIPVNGPTARVQGLEFAIQHDFSNGFGIIANTTLVDSNAKLDPNNVLQTFALTGLSNSHNLVVYYEKNRSQFRLAWNRRDGFLQSLVQVESTEPTFVEAYQQLDLSASYAINDHFSVFFEGVNLTEESVLKHGRFENQFLLAQQPGARYSIGFRGNF